MLGGEVEVDVGDDERDAEALHRDLVVGQLLEEDTCIGQSAAGPTVCLRDRQSEEPEVGELTGDLIVVMGNAPVGERHQLLAAAALPRGEVAKGVDHALLFGGQLQAHGQTP